MYDVYHKCIFFICFLHFECTAVETVDVYTDLTHPTNNEYKENLSLEIFIFGNKILGTYENIFCYTLDHGADVRGRGAVPETMVQVPGVGCCT